jgi:hypothetical protein
MKPLHALIILAVLISFAQTMDYNDQAQGAELGCMTDSECEGISPAECPEYGQICQNEDTTP